MPILLSKAVNLLYVIGSGADNSRMNSLCKIIHLQLNIQALSCAAICKFGIIYNYAFSNLQLQTACVKPVLSKRLIWLIRSGCASCLLEKFADHQVVLWKLCMPCVHLACFLALTGNRNDHSGFCNELVGEIRPRCG